MYRQYESSCEDIKLQAAISAILIEGDWKLRRNGLRALGTRMVDKGRFPFTNKEPFQNEIIFRFQTVEGREWLMKQNSLMYEFTKTRYDFEYEFLKKLSNLRIL